MKNKKLKSTIVCIFFVSTCVYTLFNYSKYYYTYLFISGQYVTIEGEEGGVVSCDRNFIKISDNKLVNRFIKDIGDLNQRKVETDYHPDKITIFDRYNRQIGFAPVDLVNASRFNGVDWFDLIQCVKKQCAIDLKKYCNNLDSTHIRRVDIFIDRNPVFEEEKSNYFSCDPKFIHVILDLLRSEHGDLYSFDKFDKSVYRFKFKDDKGKVEMVNVVFPIKSVYSKTPKIKSYMFGQRYSGGVERLNEFISIINKGY